MSFLYTPRPFTEEEKGSAVTELLSRIVPDRDFYFLLAGGIALAIMGIFLDSMAVLIASMLVAPLAYPILGISFGIVSRAWRMALRSFGMLIVSVIIALLGAWIAASLFGHVRVDPVFISFESNLYIATIIAILSGMLAAYGLIRVKVGGAMTGIGIAVSLMPPLVATGIGLSSAGSFPLMTTLAVFGLNVFGILAGSLILFLFFGFGRST